MKLKWWKRRGDDPGRSAEPRAKRDKPDKRRATERDEHPKQGPHSGLGDDSYDQRGSFGR